MVDDNDSDDEWFLDSIKRYKELIMFDTGDPVLQVELCDSSTICTLSERESGQRMISVLSLPSKMTNELVPSHGIQLSSDLRIKSGIYSPRFIKKILVVYEKDRLIATEKAENGLHLYTLNHTDSEQLVFDVQLKFPLECPEFALLDECIVVLSKEPDKPILIVDIKSGEVISQYVLSSPLFGTLKPTPISEKVVAFMNTANGDTIIYDYRQKEISAQISVNDETDSSWTVAASYSWPTNCQPTRHLYFISQLGSFRHFDLRNLNCPVLSRKLEHSCKNDFIKICTNSDDFPLLSISGFDDNVYIYNIKQNMSQIFKHDGHARTEHCKKTACVTDHLWYPNSYVISGASNNSVNCWIPHY